MSAAPRSPGRSPPDWYPCTSSSSAAGHPAVGASRVQVGRPRRCAAAGAPPGPAAAPDGTWLLRGNDRTLDLGPPLPRGLFPGLGHDGQPPAAAAVIGAPLADVAASVLACGGEQLAAAVSAAQ